MNRRRERVHHCGLTNIDFKTKGDAVSMQTYKPTLKHADFGTMGKTGFEKTPFSTFMKSKKKTGMTISENPDPRTKTTQDFYMQQGKRITAPTATLNKRSTQLEDAKWTDNVFTGDKPDFQIDLTAKAKRRINKLGLGNSGKRKVARLENAPPLVKHSHKGSKTAESARTTSVRKTSVVKPTTFSKVDVHSAAVQETQLVRLDNKQTLQGRVDLKKVRDIRRAIRRRYATRKNPNKLFHVWDQKQQKKIDTDDVANMVNKMGIKINKNEAYVLLKSADMNNDDTLNIEEFINLIHSSNEALDVDLKTLAPLNSEINKHGNNETAAISHLAKNASGQYENRMNNQMRLYLQKSSQSIGRDCLNEDEGEAGSKTYQIDKSKLKKILNHRLNLPEMLKNDDQRLDKIINEYAVDEKSEKVNYKSMLDDLMTFNYDVETNISNQAEKKVLSPHTESEYSEPIDSYQSPQLTVLDIQKVPYNKEEEIRKRSSKINRMLQTQFKTQAALTSYIKEHIDTDKNGTVDLNEFQKLIITTLKEPIENSTIAKKDVECFLSNFLYNKYGHTAVEEVAPRIFASTEEYNRIIDHFRKPQPPPARVNSGLEPKDLKADLLGHNQVKVLAEKIVDKALGNSHSKFQCFKSFDKDNDGYISYQDFVKTVNKMEIKGTNEEILTIAKSMDPDKNGFIDYQHFQKYFTPSLPDISHQPAPYVRNKTIVTSANGNLIPNSNILRDQINRCRSTKNKVMDVTNGFKGASDIHMNLKPSSRFSATPAWKDTFSNYRADGSAANRTTVGFQSSGGRFGTASTNTLHAKNAFQLEDKARKRMISENRVSRKRDVFRAFDEKAYNNDVVHDAFEQSKLNRKAAIQQNYERLCHSKII